MMINTCRCGRTPELKTGHLTLGHGDIRMTWWIECGCGLRTKEFVEGDDNLTRRDEAEIKARLAKMWNGGN